MAELPLWTDVSSDWINVWCEKENTSIKNEDFDIPSMSCSSNDNFIEICTDLDLDFTSTNINVSNEDIIQIPSTQRNDQHDLTSEYLLNSTNTAVNVNTESSEISDILYTDKIPINFTQSDPLDNKDGLKNNSQFVKYVDRDGKIVKIWECGICGKEFGHNYTLTRHLPTHTDERKFRCNVCGKAFRQMSTLSQHRAIHSAERPYVCEVCRKTFNRVSTLISHRKTHSGYKPHQCHLCQKAFHQKGNLQNHIYTHTNARPYKCDVCEKGFNQMSNLMCHKMKAHQRNDKPKYTCHICNKEFSKVIALRNHEEYKHAIKNDCIPTTSNNPVPTDPNVSSIPSQIMQNENGEKVHIIHIPDVPITTTATSQSTNVPPRVRYTNGVLVDAINTGAMQQAQQDKENGGLSVTPFALLRPIGGIPVLVRVLSVPNGKHMLVPATAEDLRAHGKITISENGPEPGSSTVTSVQIKIPVVATVVQKIESNGTVSMSVESPGPENKQMIQDSINNTVVNEQNMQFMKESCESIGMTTISQQSQKNFGNFEINTSYGDNSNYPEMIDLEAFANIVQANKQDGVIVYASSNENVQFNSFPIAESSNNSQNIILNNQNLFNDTNNLDLYK